MQNDIKVGVRVVFKDSSLTYGQIVGEVVGIKKGFFGEKYVVRAVIRVGSIFTEKPREILHYFEVSKRKIILAIN